MCRARTITGSVLSARSDLFGLGVVLCEALTGVALFKGVCPADSLRLTLEEFSKLPPALQTLIIGSGSVFGEKVSLVNTSNHYSARMITTADLAGLKLEAMLQFYRAPYGNQHGRMTFLLRTAGDPWAFVEPAREAGAAGEPMI